MSKIEIFAEFHMRMRHRTVRSWRWARPFLITVLFVSSVAHADSLCYLAASHKTGSDNLVQVFKGNCPKGYRRVSKSVLGASVRTQGAAGAQGPTGDAGSTGPTGSEGAIGPQGATGVSGAPGAQGDEGLPGVIGETGVAGEAGPIGSTGPQGDSGEEGAPGPTGATGVKGSTGDKGVDGLVSFNFHGSTGMSTVIASDSVADYWSIGDVDGPSLSKGNTISEVSTMFGSPCARMELTLSVAVAPGAGKSWIANVGLTLPNAITGAQNICTITGDALSCNAIVQPVTPLPANSMIRMGIIPVGSPVPVRAAWNARCISQTLLQ
jgi:hypothetical protein